MINTGRNELIARHIFLKTGQKRSRKQVQRWWICSAQDPWFMLLLIILLFAFDFVLFIVFYQKYAFCFVTMHRAMLNRSQATCKLPRKSCVVYHPIPQKVSTLPPPLMSIIRRLRRMMTTLIIRSCRCLLWFLQRRMNKAWIHNLLPMLRVYVQNQTMRLLK